MSSKLTQLSRLTVLLAAFVAVSVPARADDAWQAGGGPEWQKVLAAAKQEGKVVVAGSTKLQQPMGEAFKRDTGIDIEFLDIYGSELFARASREYQSGNVTLDAVFTGANGLPLATAGYTAPLMPRLLLPGVTDPKNWKDGKLKFVDTAATNLLIVTEAVAGQVFFDTNTVKPGEIKNWRDLLKPEYKGRIAIHDPRVAGIGPNMAGFLNDVLGLDFIKALYVDQQPKFTRETRQLTEWLARGTYSVALGALTEDVLAFKNAGITNIDEVLPADAPGFTVGTYVIHIPKAAPHPNAATVFLNWFASKPGQTIYAEAQQTPTRRTDVQTPSIPDYLYPKPGVKYVDIYREDYITQKKDVLLKQVIDLVNASQN